MGQERLRRVTESDKEQLFVWTNDPVTRMQSFSQEPVSWENHCAWFEKKLYDPDCYHYILEADGEAAGVIRLDRHGTQETETTTKASGQKDIYRISYSVAPQLRGRGYGKKLLQLAEYHAAVEIADCGWLFGEVKKENIASAGCFEALGYRRCEENEAEYGFIKSVDFSRCIYFRADAGKTIGNGHVMRCLTIADACRKQGMYPVFLTADTEPFGMIEARGYLAQAFGTDYRDMEAELPAYERLVPAGATVVLDSYFLKEGYVSALNKRGYRLVWLDDLGEQKLPVKLLINYNLYADELGYLKRNAAGESETQYLLGAAYAPVRPVFTKKKYEVRTTLERILITTGASDPYSAGYRFAKALCEAAAAREICVICGNYNQDIERLEKLSEQTEMSGGAKVRILQGLTDLSDVMYDSDLAVAAAGSTLYELCAVGVPALVYDFADNQKQGAQAFARKAQSVYLGDLRVDADKAEEKLCAAVRQFADMEKRQALSRRMQGISDGKGAKRIAEILGQ